MKAVWSFWSQPMTGYGKIKYNDFVLQILMYALSHHMARRFFASTELHTDQFGFDLLIDRMGLQFDTIYIDLDNIALPPTCWVAGKLKSYASQTEPFIHIDADVFLHKALPRRVLDGEWFAQHPDWVIPGPTFYSPGDLNHIADVLPSEYLEYMRWPKQIALNCGFIGGNDHQSIAECSRIIFDMMVLNSDRVSQTPNILHNMILYEQYALAAMAEVRGHQIQYLFSSFDDAYARAETFGFTHLISGSKRDPKNRGRLMANALKMIPNFAKNFRDIAADPAMLQKFGVISPA